VDRTLARESFFPSPQNPVPISWRNFMSLIKKQPVSEKKLAAVRQNQKLSHGAMTAKGRERIRAAHLRHGFDAEAEGATLRALGEDPAQFQELLESLWETYQSSDAAQEGLVIRLARVTWLM